MDEGQLQDAVDIAGTVEADLRYLCSLTVGHDARALFERAAQTVQEALDALRRGVARNGS